MTKKEDVYRWQESVVEAKNFENVDIGDYLLFFNSISTEYENDNKNTVE